MTALHTDITAAARLTALRVAVLFIAGITSLGLILCRNLPGAQRSRERAEA